MAFFSHPPGCLKLCRYQILYSASNCFPFLHRICSFSNEFVHSGTLHVSLASPDLHPLTPSYPPLWLQFCHNFGMSHHQHITPPPSCSCCTGWRSAPQYLDSPINHFLPVCYSSLQPLLGPTPDFLVCSTPLPVSSHLSVFFPRELIAMHTDKWPAHK